MEKDEFYVGYLPEAPRETASFVKKIIVVAGLGICVVALILAWSQNKFSSSFFDYGINSTIEGYYFEKPVPHIAVPLGITSTGKELFQNVLLVGFGKAGAMDVMMKLKNQKGKSFEGAKIELTGFMIYGNGKSLLQITEEDNSNIAFLTGVTAPFQSLDSIGITTLEGEIVDPKCYFGVMKPGEGKAHRSCAIRCVDGGIPPVFHASDRDEYFLIVNEKWQPVNKEVLRLIGDQISITGKEIVWNDWRVLKVNTNDLAAMTSNKKIIEQLMAFESGMTICAGQ
ncbi:MAG TPA: hypothetical protein VK589_17390 [Chryseolinea sp.]|nr:hypothetical protein [Chryseolinea sp.]